jgi:hypothetical protein
MPGAERANTERFPHAGVYVGSHPQRTERTAMDENRVGDQAAAAANGLKESITAAVGTVTDLASQARSAAVEAGGSIQGAAIKAAKQVGDAATKTYEQGARAGEYVSRNTAEQPLLALLIAGAIGYGIAYMIHRN